MARYYDMDKLKALIEAKADTLVEGKEAFLYVAKWLDLLPHEDVAPAHHAYWKVVTVIKEDCACGSNRLMQYKVCSHCEQPMGVCGTDYCGHCGAIMDGFVLEGHSDPTGHDGPCGEPGMDAFTFAKREFAREIFKEIEAVICKHNERPAYNFMLDIEKLKTKYTEEK